jgi:hypothetical protein
MAEIVVRSDRGFHGYTEFTDTYGATVKVYESSAAMQDCVWVSFKGGGVTDNDGAAHLNKEQAVELIAALQLWISDIEET